MRHESFIHAAFVPKNLDASEVPKAPSAVFCHLSQNVTTLFVTFAMTQCKKWRSNAVFSRWHKRCKLGCIAAIRRDAPKGAHDAPR